MPDKFNVQHIHQFSKLLLLVIVQPQFHVFQFLSEFLAARFRHDPWSACGCFAAVECKSQKIKCSQAGGFSSLCFCIRKVSSAFYNSAFGFFYFYEMRLYIGDCTLNNSLYIFKFIKTCFTCMKKIFSENMTINQSL